MIREADRPLLFVYIHGWQNNANSGDVCRFEHFIDTVSRFPEITGRKINVIGVYIAWRGIDVTVPVSKVLNVLEPQVRRHNNRRAKRLPGDH